ncbi:MAG TPA: flagellar filament capping protein FliD [Selenomonadales bacterium]|nr:flagellar filament capping protein FliD [Selenomonadales bacterium]
MATTTGLSFLTSPSLGTAHMNGLASGLDIDGLVSATMQMESLPMQLLQNKNTLLQSRLNSYNNIKTSLWTLKSAATDLTYSSAFKARTATTSNDKVVTATAKNGTSSGSYTIEVTEVATAAKITGSAITGMSTGQYASVTGGVLALPRDTDLNRSCTLTVNGKAISVVDGDTINDIINKINNSSAGVTAKVSSDGKQIILAQKTIGEKPITISSSDSELLTELGLDSGSIVAQSDGQAADRTVAFSKLDGANALSEVTSGYFSINGTFIKVDKDNDTLDSIVKKINSSNAGVSAIYDSTNNQLILTSKKLGDDPIELKSDGSNFLDKVGLGAGATVESGKPAQVKVNGVAVTPVGNTVEMDDITFNLTGTGTATVTVQQDADAIVEKVKNFISQYNAVLDLVNGKLTEKPDSASDDPALGNLFGDSILRSINQGLRSFTYTRLSSVDYPYSDLSQIGITTGKVGQTIAETLTGHLSLDENALRDALKADPDAVAKLFGNSLASDTMTFTGAGQTEIQLDHPSSVSSVTVTVDGVTYKQVASPPKPYNPSGTPAVTEHQFSVDLKTGKIVFADPLPAGKDVKIQYNYELPDASKGVIAQMANMLDGYTQVGGTFDSVTGSNGSITKQIDYNKKRIDEMTSRLQMRQDSLYRIYQAMESQLQTLKSQSSFLTSQLASLPSWNSNSK